MMTGRDVPELRRKVSFNDNNVVSKTSCNFVKTATCNTDNTQSISFGSINQMTTRTVSGGGPRTRIMFSATASDTSSEDDEATHQSGEMQIIDDEDDDRCSTNRLGSSNQTDYTGTGCIHFQDTNLASDNVYSPTVGKDEKYSGSMTAVTPRSTAQQDEKRGEQRVLEAIRRNNQAKAGLTPVRSKSCPLSTYTDLNHYRNSNNTDDDDDESIPYTSSDNDKGADDDSVDDMYPIAPPAGTPHHQRRRNGMAVPSPQCLVQTSYTANSHLTTSRDPVTSLTSSSSRRGGIAISSVYAASAVLAQLQLGQEACDSDTAEQPKPATVSAETFFSRTAPLRAKSTPLYVLKRNRRDLDDDGSSEFMLTTTTSTPPTTATNTPIDCPTISTLSNTRRTRKMFKKLDEQRSAFNNSHTSSDKLPVQPRQTLDGESSLSVLSTDSPTSPSQHQQHHANSDAPRARQHRNGLYPSSYSSSPTRSINNRNRVISRRTKSNVTPTRRETKHGVATVTKSSCNFNNVSSATPLSKTSIDSISSSIVPRFLQTSNATILGNCSQNQHYSDKKKDDDDDDDEESDREHRTTHKLSFGQFSLTSNNNEKNNDIVMVQPKRH